MSTPSPMAGSLPIDPRSVPVVGVDEHLDAVPASALVAEALRARFAGHKNWVAERDGDGPEADGGNGVAHKPAAVLIPILLPLDPSRPLQVLLTERAGHLSRHAGQIAFPGGRMDAGDDDAVMAALREAHEEVDLDPSAVEPLGVLPIYTTVTGYVVTPVVGLIHGEPRLRPNPAEVHEIFQVPLPFLMNPRNHRRHVIDWRGHRREWFSMPYLDATREPPKERYIWGATAGMLRNLYRFLMT